MTCNVVHMTSTKHHEYLNVPTNVNGKGPRKSVDHTLRHGVRSMLRSVARRDDADVTDLATLQSLHAEVEAATVNMVASLRAQGFSWEDIGRALNMSRQGAQQRYGKRSEAKREAVAA